MSIIKDRKSVKIDVGQINDRLFFSNMGIGFDASVIKNYESSQKRTLYGYVSACLISFKDIGNKKNVSVHINDMNRLVDPFIILISNSNEMGYNLSLTPKASLQDGMLDVLIISRIGRPKMLWLGILILFKRISWLKEASSFQTKELLLRREGAEHFESQIDGELHEIDKGTLRISIKEKSLRILVAE